MGYHLNKEDFNNFIAKLNKEYDLYGPVTKEKAGKYSDTDLCIYEKVTSFEQMVWDKKSDYSAKDILLPLNETLMYFSQDDFKQADDKFKPALVFLRSCDLHAIKRTDQINLHNKYEDYYYKNKRDKIKFVVVGCSSEFDNCACVSFKTNKCDNYDIAINIKDDNYEIDIKLEELKLEYKDDIPFILDHVIENKTKVMIPSSFDLEQVIDADIWNEYSTRCIGCGACNFVCPTCTCWTMQDLFYEENKNAGERKRVMASCMIEGFSDMAGNHKFRTDQKDRMRFKVMHKINDFNKRFDYQMCVGCGRCDDVCPEHILFSNTVNKLSKYLSEGNNNE